MLSNYIICFLDSIVGKCSTCLFNSNLNFTIYSLKGYLAIPKAPSLPFLLAFGFDLMEVYNWFHPIMVFHHYLFGHHLFGITKFIRFTFISPFDHHCEYVFISLWAYISKCVNLKLFISLLHALTKRLMVHLLFKTFYKHLLFSSLTLPLVLNCNVSFKVLVLAWNIWQSLHKICDRLLQKWHLTSYPLKSIKISTWTSHSIPKCQ
jgi:hypothetical protein